MSGHHPRPNWQDWGTFLISVVFTAIGLIILPSDRGVGVVTLALFGSCAAVLGTVLLRKLRHRSFEASRIDVVGGVPIRESRLKHALLGAWLGVLGLLMWYFGDTYPDLFRWLSLFVAAAGGAVLAGVALGRLASGFLQFDPSGLTVANRTARVAIPWDNISEVLEGELQGNPLLLIALADTADVLIEPQDASPRFYKTVARTLAMYGSHFAIMTSYYGIDLPVLAGAIRHYVSDPAARAQLEAAAQVGVQI